MKSKTKSKDIYPTKEEMLAAATRDIDRIRITHGPSATEVFKNDTAAIKKLMAAIRARNTPLGLRLRAIQVLNTYIDRHYKVNDAFPPEKLELEVKKLIEL